jgi:WD40 repeat protein
MDGPIHYLAISPSSDLIAVDAFHLGANRCEIVVFDIAKDKRVVTLRYDPGGSTFGGLAFSRDGKSVIAAGGGGKVAINHWDIERGEIAKSLSPTGAGLVMTERWSVRRDSERKTVWIYDLEAQKEVAKFGGFPAKITGAAISPDGKHLALQDYDKVLRVLEVATGKEVQKRDYSFQMKCMLFARDEPTLVATPYGSAGSAAILDLKAGKSTSIFFPANALSGDGKMMAAHGPIEERTEKGRFIEHPDGVHIYSRQKQKIIATFPIEKDWQSGPMQFTPNNRYLVYCGGPAGGSVRVWDLSKLDP